MASVKELEKDDEKKRKYYCWISWSGADGHKTFFQTCLIVTDKKTVETWISGNIYVLYIFDNGTFIML